MITESFEESAHSPRRWRWTGEALLQLSRLGVLPPEQKLELMDGEILETMPVGPLHAVIVALIARLLIRLLENDQRHVREEKPVQLGEYYEPVPDVSLVRGRLLDYTERLPQAESVLLIVEVADTSLEYDRDAKLSAYAAAGIQEYWIADLRESQIEVYREPDGPQYLLRRIHRPGDAFVSLIAPETPISVSALLGRD